MRLKRPVTASMLAAFGVACGGGSPTGPDGGGPTHTVTAVVFYDVSGSGALDAGEDSRLGGVTVSIAGRTARSEEVTGRAVVNGVPAGVQTAELRALLPFFRPGSPVSLTVPAAGEVLLAATLPIGGNHPHTYMAFGDSITAGDGSKNGQGYRLPLEKALTRFFGQAQIFNEGWPGTRSNAGASRIGGNLRRYQPAYTLILYGTNDWNECGFTVPCFTIESLRKIVQKTKAAQSLPVLATLPPANPEYGNQSRNNWTSQINQLIKGLAEEEEALLVDLETAFRSQGDLTQLFFDHVHPNDRGYAIIADEFFKAITQPAESGMSLFDDFAPDTAAPRDEPLAGHEEPALISEPPERPSRSVREG